MDLTGLWRLDATAQAEIVRRREVSPLELVEAAIARIEALNPHLNAVITPLFGFGRTQAAESTGGPFDGVPILLKDAGVEIKGTPTYLGTQALRDIGYRSRQTDEMGRRLRRAGFVFLGKTNVPPLSAGVTTEPPAFGPTRNPWDLGRSVSGSSGGSAAAVAAGMVSIAHGADATGSLRFPASACGLVALNPTSGVTPCTTPAAAPDSDRTWRAFVLARSVRDVAGALEALGDTSGLASIRGERRPLRIGLMPDFPDSGMPVEEECAHAVEQAGIVLEGLGHEVEHAFPLALTELGAKLRDVLGSILTTSRFAQIRWLEATCGRPMTEADVGPDVLAQARAGETVADAELDVAMASLRAAVRPIEAWWRDWDVLVTPTMRRVPWPLGEQAGLPHVGGFAAFSSFSGQPSMSLPLHWTADGLPVGVQFVGARGADRLLLALAMQLEDAMPWAERWPAIAGSV